MQRRESWWRRCGAAIGACLSRWRALAILGGAALAALLCGLTLHPRGLAIAGGLTVVMVLGVVWPWISLRGLRGRLSFEQCRGREGEPSVLRLSLASRVPWGAWGLTLRTGRDDASALAIAHLPGWRRTTWTRDFIPTRRGLHPEREAQLVTGFPFGLREASRPIAVERPLLVWPRTFPVGVIPEEAGGTPSEGAGFRNRPGDVGDLLGVRPYRRGDSLRRVHWGQTARHGDLIVCELQSAAAPRVQIVLDLDPFTHTGAGSDGSLEWAIRIAASYVEDWLDQGAEIELIAGRQTFSTRGPSGASRRPALLDALAGLDASGAPSLDAVLAESACRRFGQGLRLIVCTDRARVSPSQPARAGTERHVVLASAAFHDEATMPAPLDPRCPVQPWVLIDDRTRVPQLLRHRQEGRHVA